jgi:predicted  nucleic acid-binding Zn-ribbon protein
MSQLHQKIKTIRTLIDKVEDELTDFDLKNEMKKNYSEEAISECLYTEEQFNKFISDANSAISFLEEEILNQHGTTEEVPMR